MAPPNGTTKAALDDPLTAPAIGLSARLDGDESEPTTPRPSHNHDASSANDLSPKSHPIDLTADDDETAWADEEEEGEEEEEDEDLSLYETFLDNSDSKSWKLPQVLESQALRKRLRLLGQTRFLDETLSSGRFTARQLCIALGARIPFFLEEEGTDDEAFYTLLSICIARELQKRVKLAEWNTLDDVVSLIKRAENIVVLTGAGISTSLGIPDFRSKDTGLYARLPDLGLSDPQEVFDISLFREDPTIFYSIAKDILPSASNRFTPTHRFIKLLQERGKLLTNYTQNIDNVEAAAGLGGEGLVQCHGSFGTASCGVSHVKSKKRKRGFKEDDDEDDDDEDEIDHPGVMKPDITFFGEALPPTFHDRLITHDLPLVDLVLVIGTSLKVAPVSEVVGVIPPNVPQVFISREPVGHAEFDVELLGGCDLVVEAIARRCGWGLGAEGEGEGKGERKGGEEGGMGKVWEGGIAVRGVEGYEARWVVERVEQEEGGSGVAGSDGEGRDERKGRYFVLNPRGERAVAAGDCTKEKDGEEGEEEQEEGGPKSTPGGGREAAGAGDTPRDEWEDDEGWQHF